MVFFMIQHTALSLGSAISHLDEATVVSFGFGSPKGGRECAVQVSIL